MLSPIKTKIIRFFTYLWIVVFLSSQGVVFAGRSAKEVALEPWDPPAGVFQPSSPLKQAITDITVGLEQTHLVDEALQTDDVVTSSSGPSSSSTSASSSVSLERQPSGELAEAASDLSIARAFLARGGLELLMELKLPEDHPAVAHQRDFLFWDPLKRIVVFYRESTRKLQVGDFDFRGKENRKNINPNKNKIQEFSRTWVSGILKQNNRKDLLDHALVRIASDTDGSGNPQFYAVFDQRKPGPQEESLEKPRPEQGVLVRGWEEEDPVLAYPQSAFTYLDYLIARQSDWVLNFQNKKIGTSNVELYADRFAALFQFDPEHRYTLNLSHNRLYTTSIESFISQLQKREVLKSIKILDVSWNQLRDQGLKNLAPLLVQKHFKWLIIFGNDVGNEEVVSLRDSLQSWEFSLVLTDEEDRARVDKEKRNPQKITEKVIFLGPNYDFNKIPINTDSKRGHKRYYKVGEDQ